MDNIYDNNLQNKIDENEQYVFNFSKEEIMQIFKIAYKTNFISKVILCLLMFVTSAVCITVSETISIIMFIVSVIYAVLQAINFSTIRKQWIEISEISQNATTVYDVFNDKLTESLFDNVTNELISKHTVNYVDINFIMEKNNYLIFVHKNHIYYFKSDKLRSDSILFNKIKEAKNRQKINNKFIYIGMAIAFFSICAYTAIPHIINYESQQLYNPCYWINFLFIPLSATSIIYALLLKKKKIRYTTNIIIGILITLILFVNGCDHLKYNKYFGDGTNVIAEAEEKLNIDIPEPDYIEFYYKSDSYTENVDIIYETYIDYNEFIDVDYYEFETFTFNESVWLNKIPYEFLNIIPYSDYYIDNEYFILYNVNTKEINTAPTEKGKHRLVFISYYAGCMDIIEYILTI